jgi:hypothetical protein
LTHFVASAILIAKPIVMIRPALISILEARSDSTLDIAILGAAFIDEDKEAAAAVLKHAERDDLLGIIISLITLIRRTLGDHGARSYFEDLRIAAVLAMQVSQGDWHAATRITASAARLP